MKSRKIISWIVALAFAVTANTSCAVDTPDSPPDVSEGQGKWLLVWEDGFDSPTLNEKVWSKISRGTPDWRKYMSDNEQCYGWEDGKMILRGIRNPDTSVDDVPYLTGGIYTKGKMAFAGGKIEICAKFDSSGGNWPAIWMMPEAAIRWPMGGEIDIMEHLNFDGFVYQTVHSNYTYNLGIKNPANSSTTAIKRDDYNVYGVEVTECEVIFYVNGVKTMTYPKINTDEEGQFPYYAPYYLLIDQQLGGSWVGNVDPSGLPVEMRIDWVKYYKRVNNE